MAPAGWMADGVQWQSAGLRDLGDRLDIRTIQGRGSFPTVLRQAGADDAACTLVRGFGTEASVADHAAFEARFGCTLIEGYGSSEGGVAINRSADTPAGALGKPFWLLLAYNCDWRWMLDRPDTPWYPSMRLFRQEQPNEWQAVLAAVKAL